MKYKDGYGKSSGYKGTNMAKKSMYSMNEVNKMGVFNELINQKGETGLKNPAKEGWEGAGGKGTNKSRM